MKNRYEQIWISTFTSIFIMSIIGTTEKERERDRWIINIDLNYSTVDCACKYPKKSD